MPFYFLEIPNDMQEQSDEDMEEEETKDNIAA